MLFRTPNNDVKQKGDPSRLHNGQVMLSEVDVFDDYVMPRGVLSSTQ